MTNQTKTVLIEVLANEGVLETSLIAYISKPIGVLDARILPSAEQPVPAAEQSKSEYISRFWKHDDDGDSEWATLKFEGIEACVMDCDGDFSRISIKELSRNQDDFNGEYHFDIAKRKVEAIVKILADAHAPIAQPAPAVEQLERLGWYCPHCERGVENCEVSYTEHHTKCGYKVGDWPVEQPAAQGYEPVIETCDIGHNFAKLHNHPQRHGLSRCPYCLAEGLDSVRKEREQLRTLNQRQAEEIESLQSELAAVKRQLKDSEGCIARREQYIAELEAAESSDKVWADFAAWLLDHCEGEVITEEFLQGEMSKMLEAQPQTNKCGDES